MKWWYDCDNNTGNTLTVVRQKLEPMDQLKSDLFNEYDAAQTPVGLDEIGLHFDVNTVSYNSRKSLLTTKGRLKAVNMTILYSPLAGSIAVEDKTIIESNNISELLSHFVDISIALARC